MIRGTITRQGAYADKKDICELYINKDSSDGLPHEHGKKMPIYINIGSVAYEAGVHETEAGVVWISSVLFTKGSRRDKARLVDALAALGVRKGDRIRIKSNGDGTFSVVPERFSFS
jgi:hypothetical protein